VAVYAGEQDQHDPKLTVDSQHDLYVTWQDFRNGQYSHIYAQKLSPDGQRRWDVNGVPVARGYHAGDLEMAADGRDGFFTLWDENRVPFGDVLATHFDSAGALNPEPYWVPDSGGVVASNVGSMRQSPAVSPDGWGGCVVAWMEFREAFTQDPIYDLYAQRFFDFESATQEPQETLPRQYALHANYPNPFNPATTLTFDLPQAGKVKLAVYDLLGREVSVLVDGTMRAGQQRVTFDASGLPSGVYVYRLEAGNSRQAKKLVLLR
jgi:hypothetical protein